MSASNKTSHICPSEIGAKIASKALTLKDDDQKSVFANVVPSEGVNDFIQNQTVEDIDITGITDIIFKTDPESPFVAVQNDIKASRSHKTILENSVKGQSKTNGL